MIIQFTGWFIGLMCHDQQHTLLYIINLWAKHCLPSDLEPRSTLLCYHCDHSLTLTQGHLCCVVHAHTQARTLHLDLGTLQLSSQNLCLFQETSSICSLSSLVFFDMTPVSSSLMIFHFWWIFGRKLVLLRLQFFGCLYLYLHIPWQHSYCTMYRNVSKWLCMTEFWMKAKQNLLEILMVLENLKWNDPFPILIMLSS